MVAVGALKPKESSNIRDGECTIHVNLVLLNTCVEREMLDVSANKKIAAIFYILLPFCTPKLGKNQEYYYFLFS